MDTGRSLLGEVGDFSRLGQSSGLASSASFGPFTLLAGQTLEVGSLTLAMQGDGNLALYRNGKYLWGANAVGAWAPRSCLEGCSAVFAEDGTLALYEGKVRFWSLSFAAQAGDRLILSEAEPYIKIVAGGSVHWASGNAFGPFSLRANEAIALGDLALYMQGDGNLVLYKNWKFVVGSNSFPGWSPRACGGNCFASFGADGTLAIYDEGKRVWQAPFRGDPGDRLVITEAAPFLAIQPPSKEEVRASRMDGAPCQRVLDEAHALFVAVDGRDGAPGSEKSPAELARAPELAAAKVRALEAGGGRGAVCVYLRGGTYFLDQPLKIMSTASGAAASPVIYAPYPGESPVLSGGRELPGVVPVAGGIVRADTRGLVFRQLYVNGLRARRARYPADGSALAVRGWDTQARRVYLNPADVEEIESWEGVELVVRKTYDVSILRVKSASLVRHPIFGSAVAIEVATPEEAYAFTQGPAGLPTTDDPSLPPSPYHLEGACGLISEPGDWCVDSAARQVYYRLRKGERVSSLRMAASMTETLLQVDGAPGAPVSHVRFAGLTFTGTGWNAPSAAGFVGHEGGTFHVGDEFGLLDFPPAAVRVSHAVSVGFFGNTFVGLGAMGIDFHQDVHASRIIANEFRDIAGGAVVIDSELALRFPHSFWPASGSPDLATADVSRSNAVSFNRIVDFGKEYLGSVGVFGGYTEDLRVEFNEVGYAPWSGMLFGWGWRLNETPAKLNLIVGNHVHDVLRVLDDGGAIKTLGAQPGSAITRNYVHSIAGRPGLPFARTGIYLDQGSRQIYVHRNVIQGLAVRIHDNQNFESAAARDNTIIDNDSDDPSAVGEFGP